MPRQAFSDEAFYRFEQEVLFPRQWMSVAYAHRVAEPGDALPISVAGLPLIVVRGDDNEIRCLFTTFAVTAAPSSSRRR